MIPEDRNLQGGLSCFAIGAVMGLFGFGPPAVAAAFRPSLARRWDPYAFLVEWLISSIAIGVAIGDHYLSVRQGSPDDISMTALWLVPAGAMALVTVANIFGTDKGEVARN
jgi:hypothetical protein